MRHQTHTSGPRRSFLSGRKLTKQRCKKLDRTYKIKKNAVIKFESYPPMISNGENIGHTWEVVDDLRPMSQIGVLDSGANHKAVNSVQSHTKFKILNPKINDSNSNVIVIDKTTGDSTNITKAQNNEKQKMNIYTPISAYQYLSKRKHRKRKVRKSSTKTITQISDENCQDQSDSIISTNIYDIPKSDESEEIKNPKLVDKNVSKVSKSKRRKLVPKIRPDSIGKKLPNINASLTNLSDHQQAYLNEHYKKYWIKKRSEFKIKKSISDKAISWQKFKIKAAKRYKMPSGLNQLCAKVWGESKITETLNYDRDADKKPDLRDTSWQNIWTEARMKKRGTRNRSDSFEKDEEAVIEQGDEGKNCTEVDGDEDDGKTDMVEIVDVYDVGDTLMGDTQTEVSQVVRDDTKRNTPDSHVSSKRRNTIRSHAVPNGVVVVTDSRELVIKGRARMSLLWGDVTVFGYKMTRTSPEIDVYSEKSHSLFTIDKTSLFEPLTKSCINDIANKIDKGGKLSKWLRRFKKVVVLYFKPQFDFVCAHLAGLPKYSDLFSLGIAESEMLLNQAFRDSGIDVQLTERVGTDSKCLEKAEFGAVLDKWNETMNKQDASIIVCGGKNSGKSTLSRYLINSTLNKFQSVCYLDCDVGQTEFSPPGCISLHILDKPVLGPPYTHQIAPEFSCYYGAVTPGNDPSFYIEAIQTVFKHYLALVPHPPLIVNTLGWNKSLGFRLLIDIFHVLRPCVVAQLVLPSTVDNMPDLIPQCIETSHGWAYHNEFGERDVSGHVQFSHDVVIVKSMFDSLDQNFNDSSALRPKDFRDMSSLACLVPALHGGYHHSLLSVPPYRVSWREVAIHAGYDAPSARHALTTINATIVALCHADISKACHVDDNPDWPMVFSDIPLNQFIATGFVRGVDMDDGVIYVTCPLDPGEMERVNTIVKGADNVPEAVAMLQPLTVKPVHMPYTGTLADTPGAFTIESSATPRTHFQFK